MNEENNKNFIEKKIDDVKLLTEGNKVKFFDKNKEQLHEIFENGEKYQVIIETTNEGIWVADSDFKITFCNKRMAEMLGYKIQEMIGRNTAEFLYKDQQELILEAREELAAGRHTQREIRLLHKNNSVVWVISNASPIIDNKGEHVKTIALFTDITKRKQFELLLQKNTKEMQAILDSVPAMVFYKNTDNCFIRTNKLFEEVMNMPKENLEGRSLFEIYPKEQAEAFWKDDMEVINSGVAKRNIVELMETADGIKIVQTDKIPYFDENGKAAGVIGFAIDITERKKNEEELSRLASFPELNPNPITELDLNGNIFYQNPAATILFPDLMEKQLSHPWLAGFKSITEELLNEKKEKINREIIVEGRHYYKTIHYLENIKKIRIYGIDITERKEREDELHKLNRTLTALSNSNQLLMKSADEIDYLNGVCKIIIEDCGYEMVWIGYAENDEKKSIKPIAYAGFEQGYVETLNLTWADEERGQGPTGTTIRTGKISSCQNILGDPKFAPWREEALKRGYGSSIVFPLNDEEKTFGAISIYSKHPNPFSEKEIILLKELANDVAYGVISLRTKQARFFAEELLQKNEAKLLTEKNVLHTVMDNTKAGLAYLDRDFNFIALNSTFCKNNGRTEDELLQKNYFDFFPSEENRLLFERVRDAGQHIEIHRKPLILRSQPWQDITYWDWTLTPVKNSEGYVYGLVISFVDVSESVKSIEDLKIHGRKLEQITAELKKVQLAVENASDIIFITDGKGKIIYINRAIKNIMGYKQKELVGKKPNFWMENMPNKFFAQMWRSIYFSKEPFVGEIQDRKKDGEIFTAEVRIAPVLDKNGQILSFVGIERDVTEAKRLDTAKTEFISLAAHQLRTPITAISLTAEMLLGGLSGKMNKESEEYLVEIMDGVKKMSEMIEMFLNVSRIEMKTFEVMPQPSNIAKIIEENIKSVLPQIKKRELELRKNISEELPVINVDAKVMDIILENLLSNAIKYTQNKGIISVDAQKYRESIMIKISDTGYGIPKKQQDKVFEKLFRADNTEQKIDGVGLGLYLCKSLIEQSGGKIWLSSEENKGTTFYVDIPLTGMKKNSKNHRA